MARDRSGYWQMWRAAAGGGLLTVITAAIKAQLVGAHLPLFVEGFLIGTDYAVTFVLLQIFHFALATKQPSMTAARPRRHHPQQSRRGALEQDLRLRRADHPHPAGRGLRQCHRRVHRRHRVPVPVDLSCSRAPFLSTGQCGACLREHESADLRHGDFRRRSPACMLWIGALVGGWVENFIVFNRIPARDSCSIP